MKKTPLFALLSYFLATSAIAGLSVHGNAPLNEEPGLESKLDKVWQYEKQKYLAGQDVADPEIWFFAFDRARESADFVAWQSEWILDNPSVWLDWTKIKGNQAPKEITQDWVQAHSDLFPFPPSFLAFHYDGSNRIQINPEPTFLRFYTTDPFGAKSDAVGFGYYSAAHELMHYSFEQLGIPGRLHHCLFITPRAGKPTFMEDVAQYLIDQKISSNYVMLMGARKEKDFDPCGQLSAEEKAQVAKFAKELP